MEKCFAVSRCRLRGFNVINVDFMLQVGLIFFSLFCVFFKVTVYPKRNGVIKRYKKKKNYNTISFSVILSRTSIAHDNSSNVLSNYLIPLTMICVQ